jgi:sugar/nucleoside kinase (ribokinase family)
VTLLFAGRSTFDVAYVCPRFPREDEKLSSTQSYAVGGGPALNAAVTARALGSDVRLATLLGSGPIADAVREDLAHHRVPVEDFAASGCHGPAGFEHHRRARERIAHRHRPAAAASAGSNRRSRPSARKRHGFVLTDGFLPELAVPLCREARRRGIPVALDGGSWKPWTAEIIAHVDCAIVSERFRPGGEECRTSSRRCTRSVRCAWPLPAASGRCRGATVITAGRLFRRGSTRSTRSVRATCFTAPIATSAGAQAFPEALKRAAEVAAQSCRHFGPRAWIAELER